MFLQRYASIVSDSCPLTLMMSVSLFCTVWVFMTFTLINQVVKGSYWFSQSTTLLISVSSICTQGGLQKISSDLSCIRGGVFLLESQFRTSKIGGFRLKGPTLFSWCADQTFCGKNHIRLIYMSVLPPQGLQKHFLRKILLFLPFYFSFFHLSKGS